jgi:ATP-dependent Zn protease
MTAYHEARPRHRGAARPEHDPVHKVTIIPRGRALGVTQFLPTRSPLDEAAHRKCDRDVVRWPHQCRNMGF